MCVKKNTGYNGNSTTNLELTTDKPVRQVPNFSYISFFPSRAASISFLTFIHWYHSLQHLPTSLLLPPLNFQPPYTCVHNHKRELLILLDPLQPHSSVKSPWRKIWRKETIYRLGLHCRVTAFVRRGVTMRLCDLHKRRLTEMIKQS